METSDPLAKHLVIYDAKNEHLASKESCIIIKNVRFFSLILEMLDISSEYFSHILFNSLISHAYW